MNRCMLLAALLFMAFRTPRRAWVTGDFAIDEAGDIAPCQSKATERLTMPRARMLVEAVFGSVLRIKQTPHGAMVDEVYR